MMEREARSTAVVKEAGAGSKLHELEELHTVLLDKKPDEFNHLATFVALNEKVRLLLLMCSLSCIRFLLLMCSL
jgi:hypothetical protein